MKNLEKYSSVIKDAGLKITQMRVSILDLIDNSHKPLTAKDIILKLNKKTKAVDTVTVYRTLSSFEKSGLIKSLSLGKDAVSYESNNHHHHHIVCEKCSTIEDFEMCVFDEVKEAVLKHSKQFGEINKHSFELFGICKKCKK